jgi:hypothetical protein
MIRGIHVLASDVFGAEQLRELRDYRLKTETIAQLAEMCHGMRKKMKKSSSAGKKRLTGKQRAKLFAEVHFHALQLRKLISETLPIDDLAAMHDCVDRLYQTEPDCNGFNPGSWGAALSALDYWAQAADMLGVEINASARSGPVAAPQWRAEFVAWIARVVSPDGIGVASKAGRFLAICSICYTASNIPASPSGDVKTFVNSRP